MCCGFTRISLVNSPSSKFHSGRQYWPVDSMAISVTWQFFSQARNCLRSRVKVRNFRFLVSMCCLSRGSQHAHRHAVLVYVNAAAAAQVLFHKCSFDRRAKDAWDDEKTFLRVFIHRKVETTVPGSSDCVLTRFKLGLESTNR